MTKFLKTLLATASVAAVMASAPAHANNSLNCPANSGLDQCFQGALFGTDTFKAGTLNLGAGFWDLTGFFGSPVADLTLSLVNATTHLDSADTNFSHVAGGKYDLKIAGTFTSAAAFAPYQGGFKIQSAVPEPQTYALLLAGLMAVGYVARRRKAD